MSDEPHIDFTTFIMSIASAAFVGLGQAPNPGTQKTEVNLELARHNIDLLDLLKEKTKGNLSADESRLIEQVLYELRMRFVEARAKGQQNKVV